MHFCVRVSSVRSRQLRFKVRATGIKKTAKVRFQHLAKILRLTMVTSRAMQRNTFFEYGSPLPVLVVKVEWRLRNLITTYSTAQCNRSSTCFTSSQQGANSLQSWCLGYRTVRTITSKLLPVFQVVNILQSLCC